MFDKLEIFRMAAGMANHAEMRQSVIARNIAQADTPGYRARDVAPFSDTYRQTEDRFTPLATRVDHLMRPAASPAPFAAHVAQAEEVSPNGNSVSLETQMMKAVETRTEHDMALGIYKTALNIMRTSIGR